MSAAIVMLIMSAVAVVLFLTSGGRDRFRMIVGGLWGLVLGTVIGASVLAALGSGFGTIAALFGA